MTHREHGRRDDSTKKEEVSTMLHGVVAMVLFVRDKEFVSRLPYSATPCRTASSPRSHVFSIRTRRMTLHGSSVKPAQRQHCGSHGRWQ